MTSLQSIPRDLKYIISISDSISEMRYADLGRPLNHRLMLVRTWNNDRTDRNFLSFGKKKYCMGLYLEIIMSVARQYLMLQKLLHKP